MLGRLTQKAPLSREVAREQAFRGWARILHLSLSYLYFATLDVVVPSLHTCLNKFIHSYNS